AAVAVDDQDLLASIARHLVGGFLQQGELHAAAVGHGSGLVACLGDLAEVIFREDHRVFLLGRMQRRVSHVKQIGADRQVRAVLLQNSERQQARALGAANSFAKVRGCELFPVHGEFSRRRNGLRARELRQSDNNEQRKKHTNGGSLAADVRNHGGISLVANSSRSLYSNVSIRMWAASRPGCAAGSAARRCRRRAFLSRANDYRTINTPPRTGSTRKSRHK